ncbi:MAG: DMT family transporter [Acidobacteria bacterium]|nr:DMT family transporter [Acidobacteriota bacterium]
MMFLWALNIVVGKWALGHIDPLTLASFRVTLAGLILLPIFLIRCRGVRILPQDRSPVLWMGLLGVAGNQMLFTIGLSQTTSGHSSLVVSSGPVFVLLIAGLLGMEHFTWKKIAGMAISISGVVLLALEHGLDLHSGTLAGDVLTMSGSFSFAGYVVMGKRVAGHYNPVAMNFFNFAAGGVIVLPLAVWCAWRLNFAAVGWQGWVGLLYMAVFASVVAYLIYYWALKYLAASRIAAFSYLLPIMALLLGTLFQGEKITGHLLGAGALILGGVYLTELHTSAADEDDELPEVDSAGKR